MKISIRIAISFATALGLAGCPDKAAQPAPAGSPGTAQAGLTQQVPETVQGYLDVTGCELIQGWAWAPATPGERLTVEVLDGDMVVGSLVAAGFREDLVAAHIGDGEYGFSLPTPAALKDGQPHSISARVRGKDEPLPNGPKTLNCKAPSTAP